MWHYWAAACDVESIRFALGRYQMQYPSEEVEGLLKEKDRRGGTLLHSACLAPSSEPSDLTEIIRLVEDFVSVWIEIIFIMILMNLFDF